MRPILIWIAMAGSLSLGIGAGARAAMSARETQADVNKAVLSALPKGEHSVAEIGPSAASRMERCQGPLTAFIMGEGAYRTARVECQSPHWTLYVEVSLVRMENVLVATRSLAMGRPLEEGDFQVVSMASNDVAGDPVSASEAIGKEAAAPLAPGETITRNQIVVPLAVHNGDSVIIHWTSSRVAATAAGTALESGGIGESILVENDGSHRRITVIVLAEGRPPTEGQPFILAPQ